MSARATVIFGLETMAGPPPNFGRGRSNIPRRRYLGSPWGTRFSPCGNLGTRPARCRTASTCVRVGAEAASICADYSAIRASSTALWMTWGAQIWSDRRTGTSCSCWPIAGIFPANGFEPGHFSDGCWTWLRITRPRARSSIPDRRGSAHATWRLAPNRGQPARAGAMALARRSSHPPDCSGRSPRGACRAARMGRTPALALARESR